jgi:hypothetical protein
LFIDRRNTALKLIVNIAALNSLIILVIFILMGSEVMPELLPDGAMKDYIVPVTLAGVLPIAIGAYGLYQRRMWGLSLFTLGHGALLGLAIMNLITAVEEDSLGVMFFISIYLILFSLIAFIYSWTSRYSLRDY